MPWVPILTPKSGDGWISDAILVALAMRRTAPGWLNVGVGSRSCWYIGLRSAQAGPGDGLGARRASADKVGVEILVGGHDRGNI
jgi:hypothetical protein